MFHRFFGKERLDDGEGSRTRRRRKEEKK